MIDRFPRQIIYLEFLTKLLGCLPILKLILLDTYHGKGATSAREYDELAEREGLRLLRYDGSSDGVWYPLNALVLPGNRNTSIVVVDRKAKSLIDLLKDEGVHLIEVEMPQHSYPGGKIRCQTNTYNPKDGVVLDRLLEKS